jgi:hypothetical protein
MKNIINYFDNILTTKGYEAWEEANAAAWEMFEDDDGVFEQWAEAKGIDLEASRLLLGTPTTYLQSWIWDNIEE